MDRLGRFFKTDIKYLISGGTYIASEYITSVIAGIAFGFLVANTLNPTEYGFYKYILSVGGLIGAFTLTGLSGSLTQAIAKGFDGSLKTISRAQLYWSSISIIIGLIISGFYLLKGAYILGLSILLVSILIPLSDLGNLSGAYLSGKELFRLKSRLNIIRTIVVTSILAVIAFFFREAHVMVVMQYLLGAVSLLIILYFTLKLHPPKNEETSDEVSYGKHLSIVDIIQRAFSQLDKIVVFQFFGATALASYSIALMPVLQLSSISKVIRTLVAPRFSKRSFKEIHATIFHKIFAMTLLSSLIMLLYMVLVPYIYQYLLPQYVEVVPLAQMASLTLLFTSQTLFGQVLVSHKCKRELYIFTIIENIFFALSIGIGGLLFGVTGVLIGFVASQGLNMIIAALAYYFAYRRHTI